MELSLLFIVFYSVLALINGANPVVQLPEYEVTGLEYSFEHNGARFVSNAFYGMPYAQAPVGERRFEKAVPLVMNSSRKIMGSELPPGCHQQEDFTKIKGSNLREIFPVSEDCLFLNVVAPSEPPPCGKKYPVIVWIHGGGFVYGMSRFYGMETLARHFNPRGIVVVGIQYRLAFLGFLSLDSSYANIGLYDQAAALKWINTNIDSFGGDSKRVTVWGNSAGSVSTHALTLSPFSNSYFRYAIQSSGSLYNLWSHSRHSREISVNFTTTLGCSSTDVNAAKACLKTKTIEQMYEAAAPYNKMNYGMDAIHWTPHADEGFFDGKSIKQLTEMSPIKNIIYGTTYGEGLLVTLANTSIIASVFAVWLGKTVDEQDSYTETNFTAYMANFLNTQTTSGKNRTEIQNLLDNYYYKDAAQAINNTKFWYTQETTSQTHGSFMAGISMEIKHKLDWGGKKMYMYLFDYVSPKHLKLTGLPQKYAPHAYEYQYLTDGQPYFDFNNQNDTNDVEKYFTLKLVNGMAAFVKTGNPSTDDLAWPVISNASKIDYMEVGETVAAGNTHFVDMFQTWNKVYALGYGSDVLL